MIRLLSRIYTQTDYQTSYTVLCPSSSLTDDPSPVQIGPFSPKYSRPTFQKVVRNWRSHWISWRAFKYFQKALTEWEDFCFSLTYCSTLSQWIVYVVIFWRHRNASRDLTAFILLLCAEISNRIFMCGRSRCGWLFMGGRDGYLGFFW